MFTPTISIIVPVYKAEEYLKRCLDSIKNQTFKNWECILIDDGSPDNSGQICDEYAQKDERFRVIHQENKGVSAARNAGLEEAKGEWIGFVDSDDWLEEDIFSYLYDCAVKSEAEVVVSGIVETDGTNESIKHPVKNGWIEIPNEFEWYIHGPWAKLFSHALLRKYNILFPEGIALAEDLFFTFQVYIKTDKIWGIDKFFYNYFQNNNSAVHLMTEKKIFDEVDVLKRIEQVLTSENKYTEDWKRWLVQKKDETKKNFIYNLKCPRFDLWRNTFSEDSNDFRYSAPEAKLLRLMMFLHLDFLIRFHSKLKKVLRKKL